jgi:DNA-binding response OmpR family regulator
MVAAGGVVKLIETVRGQGYRMIVRDPGEEA